MGCIFEKPSTYEETPTKNSESIKEINIIKNHKQVNMYPNLRIKIPKEQIVKRSYSYNS